MKKENKRKIRVLAWIDSPICVTGFSTVARGILNNLAATGRYAIDIIGINDTGGWKNPETYPYRIWPARIANDEGIGDFHGRPRLVASILGQDKEIKPPWDIIFTLNDPFILEEPLGILNAGTLPVIKKTQSELTRLAKEGKVHKDSIFKIISYWPIDSAIKENWVDIITLPDKSVVYTEYGKRMVVEANKDKKELCNLENLRIIYHGIDFNIFKPISEKERQEFRDRFKGRIKKETFLIGVIARNQLRKDIPRTLQVFSEFIKRRPQSFLYLHMKESDAWGSLREYARNWHNLEFGQNWGIPLHFTAQFGVPSETLNKIYNASDCILSTTLGEGFGFYNLEAFATKKIVIAPNNTTHPELFGYDHKEDISDMETLWQKVRGVPIKCGSTSSEWAAYGIQDLERIRPLTNVEDAVRKLIWVYDNPDKVKDITERAYKWVQQYSWQNIAKQWDALFMEAFNELENERAKIKVNFTQTAGRTQLEPQRIK